MAAARRAGADAIIVPGDLWDADHATFEEIRRQLDALASFGGPVLVAPGSLDAPARLPLSDTVFRDAVGLGAWPENVHIFADGTWSAFPLPGREDAVFVGRRWDGAPLPDPRGAPAPLSVLVANVANEKEGEARVPRGWAWGAFGGAITGRVLRDEAVLRGALAGAPVPSSFGPPEPSFLVVRLAHGAAPQVTRVRSSGVRFLDVDVACDGLETTGLLDRAAARLDEAGAGPRDAVRLTLEGTPHPSARIALSALAARVLHLAIRDRTERPSPGEAAATAEGRFAEEMRARIAAAAEPAAARTVALALELGRAALTGRPFAAPGREDA